MSTAPILPMCAHTAVRVRGLWFSRVVCCMLHRRLNDEPDDFHVACCMPHFECCMHAASQALDLEPDNLSISSSLGLLLQEVLRPYDMRAYGVPQATWK